MAKCGPWPGRGPAGNFPGSTSEPPRKSPQYEWLCWTGVPRCSRMRDLFEDIFVDHPIDPVGAARRAMRPALRRRFYADAGVAKQDGAFAVMLDGKPVRTPARHALCT